MIKGVNKSIIEINETGNKYFEKAILFVKPDHADISEKRLEKCAKEFLNEYQAKSEHHTTPFYEYFDLEQDRKRKRRLFLILGGYLLGLCAMISFFIFK